MTEKDHYKYGLSGDKVDVDVAERLRAQIRELKAQDEVHWKTRRSLLDELARCRAANVYDANAHRKAAELDVAVERIRELETENAEARVLLALVQVQTEYYASDDNSISLAIDALLAKGSELETKGDSNVG